jgi:hypothetical protein
MIRRAVFAVLLAGIVAGCASSVEMATPTIPAPLVERIPVNIGLRMPDNFQHFVHKESVYGREEWTIDLGGSNAAFFRQLFGYLFDSVRVLGANDDPTTLGLDALIEPSIDAFEFSTPNQSKTSAFAVWIRYRLKVYDRDGRLVSNWPVSAYGKASTDGRSNKGALQRAALLAMRDAAALMVMKFDKVTRISELAEEPADRENPAPTAEPEQALPVSLEEGDDETS